MKKIFNLDGNFRTKEVSDDTIKISGYASTKEVDREGDVILPSAWTKSNGLDNFKKNPIILFNHNRNEPIGRATEIEVDENGLKMTAEINKSAGKVYDLVKSGVLSTFSVGFRIKDAEFREESLGFLITDAELYENSVVTVPANAGATFSVSKSFDESEDFEEFRKQFTKNESVDTGQSSTGSDLIDDTPKNVLNTQEEKFTMDPEELKALVAEALKAEKEAERAENLKAEAEKAKAQAEEEARKARETEIAKQVATEVSSGAAELIADLRKELSEKDDAFAQTVAELKSDIEMKADEMNKIHSSKRIFDDRNGSGKDWTEQFSKEIDDAYILGLACNKSWDQTKFGKQLVEKANTWSGVEVSSDTYELTVSTNVERDIQLELVLAPMFREVEMNSASMIFPILPDAGYAEWTAAQTAGGISGAHGNLAERGDAYGSPYGGVDLTEKTVTTKKLMSQSFLADETEEDAIMPVLPLIRESMIRSHARAVEAMILVGNHADGPFGTGGASPNGLIQIADAQALQGDQGASGFAATDKATASDLLQCRIGMGKYGKNPSDIVYVVSLDAYYNLLEDPEFQDVNLVGDMATKRNGEVGMVFGSRVMVCDEFASKAAAKFFAVAVNTRNYMIPRLRGFTVESDREVREQRRVLVMSQRIGFDDIIPTSSTTASVYGYQYKLT